MDRQTRLLLDLNQYHIEQISKKVIAELVELNDENLLLSGNDSGLKNVWEEICAQQQQERSDDWEGYEATIENFIGSELEVQPQPVNDLLIYLAKIEVEEGQEEFSNTEYVVKAILSNILAKAEVFKNHNITRFLEQDFDEDGEDGEDDES